MTPAEIWRSIERRLDAALGSWRGRIKGFGQVAAVEARAGGKVWSDSETFEALAMALLSSNTEWSKIERIQAELTEPFREFSLTAYARLTDEEVTKDVEPWFRAPERKAGGIALRAGLVRLVRTAQILCEYSRLHGTADGFFTSLMDRVAGDPKQAALRVGRPGEYKLPGFGVPLAAEALKNLGYDVAKPDRHVKRAVAAFGLVAVGAWPEGKYAVPKVQDLAAMEAVERIASASGERVALVDNAIWLLGAKSGLWLMNGQLKELVSETQ